VKKLIAIHSVVPVGGTFLDWSIHYVSGQKLHYNCLIKQWDLLVDNPLTTTTAHAHPKNHPSGVKELGQYLDSLPAAGVCSLYPYFQEYNHWAKELGYDLDDLTNEHWRNIEQLQQSELSEIARICQAHTDKNITVTLSTQWAPYLLMPRAEPIWLQKLSRYKGLADFSINKNYNQEFEIWDLREKLALDIRPFRLPKLHTGLDLEKTHYQVNAEDLWFAGIDLIPNIINWLELPFDTERYHFWKDIYHDWQTIQFRSVKFIWQLNSIVSAIVNNHYYPLEQLNLMQEAIILHCLMYQYNLNIKNWQLTKFPNNTKELHSLLEPNQHILDITYQDVLRTSVDSLRSSTRF
jgi:hypothetical protein